MCLSTRSLPQEAAQLKRGRPTGPGLGSASPTKTREISGLGCRDAQALPAMLYKIIVQEQIAGRVSQQGQLGGDDKVGPGCLRRAEAIFLLIPGCLPRWD